MVDLLYIHLQHQEYLITLDKFNNMETVYIGSTLVNDVMLGSQRMDDVTLSDVYLVEYLIVAGGGGGGGKDTGTVGGGGGGAGGLTSGSFVSKVTSTSYTVRVGRGAPIGGLAQGTDGAQSQFGAFTTTGGGGGGGGTSASGRTGGSGGGGRANSGAAGSGTANQGNNGGAGNNPNTGGGGGGARSVGLEGNLNGFGGSGSLWLDGIEYSRGGFGSSETQNGLYGNGGFGAPVTNPARSGGAGVQGIVKVRYKSPTQLGSGGTVTSLDGYIYHTFTSIATSSFTF